MNRFLALAGTELRLTVRNRTAAVTGIFLPVALGILWSRSIPGSVPHKWATVASLQLSVVLAMSIYVSATTKLVSRRHAFVLKRLRTTELSDAEVLMATVAPNVVLGLAQLVMFGVVDVSGGMDVPNQPVALALALVGGLLVVVTAALVTASIASAPERAQIATLPLTFILLGGATAVGVLSSVSLRAGLTLLPGISIGTFTQLAFAGDLWSPRFGGIPLAVPALIALVLWPTVFGVLAAKRFRWERRI